MTTTYTLEQFLERRNIETPCPKCSGFGVRVYGNTATWHGGIGGCAMTNGICDGCWGSGDKDHPWLDLRTLKNERKNWEKDQCLQYLADRLGVSMPKLKSRVAMLSALCHKQATKRKIPDGEELFWWCHEWQALGDILNRLVGN